MDSWYQNNLVSSAKAPVSIMCSVVVQKKHIDKIFSIRPKAHCTFTTDQTGESFITKPGKLCSIVSKSINHNDPRSSKIGLNCKMDGLGSFDWLEDGE